MTNRAFRAICVAYLALCLALSSCGSAAGPRLSQPDAIRIAEEQISREFGGSLSSYNRMSVSYMPEGRKWEIAYQKSNSDSRFSVEVDDRSGESQIWMP
jgi:hypothetical protein